MNKRKKMIIRANTQMIINADTLEESGWYRHMMGKNRAMNKLIGLMVKEFNERKIGNEQNRPPRILQSWRHRGH